MECVKTMVFTVLQAHGQVLDRTLEPLFSRSQREALSQGVLRVTKGVFLRFLMIFGLPGDSIFDLKVRFFGGPFFSRF